MIYYKGPFRTPVPTSDRFYCTGIRFTFIFKNLCLLQVSVYFYSLLGPIWPFTVLILIAVMYGGNITAHLCGSAQGIGYIVFAPYKLAVRSNLRQCSSICYFVLYAWQITTKSNVDHNI